MLNLSLKSFVMIDFPDQFSNSLEDIFFLALINLALALTFLLQSKNGLWLCFYRLCSKLSVQHKTWSANFLLLFQGS